MTTIRIKRTPVRPGDPERARAWDRADRVWQATLRIDRVLAAPERAFYTAVEDFGVGYGIEDAPLYDALTAAPRPARRLGDLMLRWAVERRDALGDEAPPCEVTIGDWAHRAYYDTVDLPGGAEPPAWERLFRRLLREASFFSVGRRVRSLRERLPVARRSWEERAWWLEDFDEEDDDGR